MVINIGERLEALRAEGKPFPDALRPHQVEVLSILLPNKTIFSLKSLGGCYRAHFGRSSCCIEHCNGRWKVSAADGRQCFWPGYMWTQFVIFDQYKVFEISEEGKTAILILPLVALEPQVEDEMTRLGLRFVSLTRSPVESLEEEIRITRPHILLSNVESLTSPDIQRRISKLQGISPQSCTETDFEMKTSNFVLFLLISVVSVHFRAIYDETIRCQA